MTMIVGNRDQRDKLVADGYFVVSEKVVTDYGDHKQYMRWELAAPWRTCLHPLSDGWVPSQYCLMDRGHRGRHSSVVFSCDSCGKTRRGQPYQQDENAAICFMCVRGLVRYERHDGKRQKSIFCN